MKTIGAIVLCLLMGSVAPAGADTADALLARAMSSDSGASYAGVVEVVRIGNRDSEASVYRIEHRAPDLTRRLYTAPSSLAGDAIVSKGDVSFSIDAKRHRIVETRNDAVDDRLAFNDNYLLLRTNYRAVERGVESFDGRPAIDIALINRYSHRPAMLVRIDRFSKVVLDREEFSPDGALVSEIRFTEIHYTAPIPSSDFELPKAYALVQGPTFAEPSENASLVVRRAGFPAREPRALPEGFSPVEASLIDLRGVRTVHLLYSDGIRTVSLFESAKPAMPDMEHLNPQATSVGGRSGEFAELGALEILTWSDGNLSYTLVGELGRAELARIAASVTP